MNKNKTIAVFGANGRVGKRVVEILLQRKYLVEQIEQNTDISNIICDAVIDFSSTEALENVCTLCKKNKAPLVCGTTGYTNSQLEQLQGLKQFVQVDYRQNFSDGINALGQLIEKAKQLLPSWDCEIVEIHRKGKKDSPSGTALALSGLLTDAKHRKGHQAYSNTTIHSLRMGSVFGTHTVIFANNGECLTLTHNAESVDIFAEGAVNALEKILNDLHR